MCTRYQKLRDVLFPRTCVGCQTIGAYLCVDCKKELIPHPDLCPFCHRVMPYGQTCPDCLTHHRFLRGIMVAFVYTTLIKKLILRLKFYHQYDIAEFLAQRLVRLIQTNPALMQAKSQGLLSVSYVPSHRWRRLMMKGYNQSKLLSIHVANHLELPCIQLREKTKYTKSQTKLKREQRLVNLRNSFTSTAIILPEKATVIIIDDITTTGATIDELATKLFGMRKDVSIRGVVVGRHGR